MLKPREKLQQGGLSKLSNAELVAIILNQGNRNENVFELSRRLISDYGPKPLAFEYDLPVLQKKYNLGFVQACKLMACFELGRRTLLIKPDNYLMCAQDVFKYLNELRQLKKEQMRGLYFDNRNRLLHDEVIAVGNLTTSIIHPREIFRPAFIHNAAAIIVAHNHPSGDARPSDEDIEVTAELRAASKILRIQLLDHVIIGHKNFFSMKEGGVI